MTLSTSSTASEPGVEQQRGDGPPRWTMSEVHATLVRNWSPPFHLSGDLGTPAMHEIWDEFLRVHAVDAWRSASALCGQILEANVRSAVSARTQETTRKLTFEKAIDEAIKLDLLGAPARRTIFLALHSARKRRNFVSHFSPTDSRRPTEKSTLHLLASLICFSDWLAYPDARTHKPPKGELDAGAAARHAIAGACLNGLLPEGTTWEVLLADAVAVGSAKSVYNTINRVTSSSHGPDGLLAQVLHVSFYRLVRGAARSDIFDVLDLIRGLRRLRMTTHAQVLASLLPIDAALLQILQDQRPATALKRSVGLLDASRKADNQQYDSTFRSGEFRKELVSELTRVVADGQYDARDFPRFFRQLPLSTRAEILGSADWLKALTASLPGKPMAAYGDVLASVPWIEASRASDTRNAYLTLCGALLARCRVAASDEFGRLLVKLADVVPLDGPLVAGVLGAYEQRASGDPTAHGGLEVSLWYAARQMGATEVIDHMSNVLVEHAQAADRASAWCVQDLLNPCVLPRLQLSTSDLASIRSVLLDAECDAYKRLRVTYALLKHDVPLLPEEWSEISRTLQACQPSDSLSALLRDRVADHLP